MADNYLLVPIQLDVMVLNSEAEKATPFNRSTTQYQNLKTFTDPDPPFPTGASDPVVGIYLHWTLPKAIRQGTYDKNLDGRTEFYFAPNRWLVVRVWSGASEVDAIKAWLLQSDFLSDPGSSTEANFIDPSDLKIDGTPNLKNMGQALPFDSELKSLPSQPHPFLKAIGPGSVTFASFSPNVQNVFAFTDPLQDHNGVQISKGSFTYYVVGWYSDANIDPLSDTNDPKNQWKLNAEIAGTYKNDAFDWYVFANSNNIPRKMLLHGMVSSVSWDLNADNPLPKNYPIDIQSNVKVAIGNTAVDALSALVRLYQNPDKSEAVTEADLLEAFQYDLLDKFDQPGSSELLNMTIREHWFGASSGGCLWRIVPQENKGTTASPTPPAPVLAKEQAELLATLNFQQAELDRQYRILKSMQWNLHALWWKYNWLQLSSLPDDPDNLISNWFTIQLCSQIGNGAKCNNPVSCNNPSGSDPSKESWYYCQVQAQHNAWTAANAARDASKNQLKLLIDKNTQLLKATNLSQYYFPNDPVLLVTGLGRATNFEPQGSLLCRLPSQTLHQLRVGSTIYRVDNLIGTNIQKDIPVLNDPNSLLPDAVQQLHTEFFFLSPQLFADDVGGTVTVTDVQNAIEQLPEAPTDGQLPPVAFTTDSNDKRTWEWQQPWVPLLLDWKVAVLQGPAYSSNPDQPTCTFNQKNWTFDGSDYNWTGSTRPDDFDESTQMVLSGRTFITPYLVFSLADKLKNFVEKHHLRDPKLDALLEDLDQYIEGIKTQDILSQRLSGLMAQMVQRSLIQTVVPSGDITKLLANDIHGVPMPYPAAISLKTGPPWDYGPMVGTFFVFQKLTVVDTFGRTIDLMLANNNNSPQGARDHPEFYFYPITGWNLQSPTALLPPQLNESISPTERMIQLPPRVAQDSQLAFNLISNDGQNSDINHVADGNPICGWIVPNHLDRSLSIYGSDGTAFGELYLSKHVHDQYTPVWQPDPTDLQAPQCIKDIPNAYLRAMLQTIYDRTDNGVTISDFIRVIDETLWTINPRGERKDQNLSVLIGRPLAVVRAQLALKLRGVPFYNQDWWNTFKVDLSNRENLPKATEPAQFSMIDGGLLNYLWPVRLGTQALRNDGLIGYYTDNPSTPANSFQVFNTVIGPGAPSDYLKQIGADNNFLQLRFIHDDSGVPDSTQNQICNITMLLDPRGSVHAFSGLLPVTDLAVPSKFVNGALQKMCYTFRAGPFLSSPDAVRIPRPMASKGTWTWFDKALKTTLPVSQSDQNVRISNTAPLIKEGWLRYTPHPPMKPDEDKHEGNK